MIVQTLSGIVSQQDFLNAMEILKKNGLLNIRINLCKYSIEKSIKICTIIKNYINDFGNKYSIFLDLPYPYNKSRIIDYGKNNKNIVKGKNYNILLNDTANISETETIMLDSTNFKLNAHQGSTIYYGDGEGAFKVTHIHKDYLTVTALNSFYIVKGKAILCGYKKMPFERMQELLSIISEIKSDVFVMPSFVEDDDEMIKLSKSLGENVEILAKIETNLAVINFDKILEQSNGVVIARGDLAMNVNFKKFLDIEKK